MSKRVDVRESEDLPATERSDFLLVSGMLTGRNVHPAGSFSGKDGRGMNAMVSMLRSVRFGLLVVPTAFVHRAAQLLNQANRALRLSLSVKRLAMSGHRGRLPLTGDKTNDSYRAGLDCPKTRWPHRSL